MSSVISFFTGINNISYSFFSSHKIFYANMLFGPVMKKIVITIFILICCAGVQAQNNIPATDALAVEGKVKKPVIFSLAELSAMPAVEIPEQIIYNHLGEVKDTLWNMRGIPIKLLMTDVLFDYTDKKELNRIYFSMTASDGYTVIFSWNEIYNTEVGDSVFVITEMQGKKIEEMPQRILLMSASDIKTGRRYVKGLKKIEVCIAE